MQRVGVSSSKIADVLVPGLHHQGARYLAALVMVLDAVIVGPMVGRGNVDLLDLGDYPQGPHPPFAPSVWGFPPGLTSRAPVEALLYWLFQSVHWSPLHLLPFVAVAPLACLGFSRLFPRRYLATGAATLLYTVNPFVYERMANGQVYIVMGYALLPILIGLVLRPLASLTATAVLAGFVFALDVAVSIHYLFIDGLALVIIMVAHLAYRQTRVVLAVIGTSVCGAVLSMYWLIPAARATGTIQSNVTTADLSVFQTVSDQRWGLAVNVIGLYGFWRPGVPLVKDDISGWPFLLVALLMVGGYGIFELMKRWGAAGKALAASCGAVVVLGAVLAIGAQGPTGVIYLWLFAHVPGFKVMREAEKFSSLIALGYAVCFGIGTEATACSLTRKLSKMLCVGCVVAVALIYGYTELWGFDGYAKPTVYPISWAAADRSMSPGSVALALPWRAYLQVPWAEERVIANPIPSYFDRPVISADDLEAGPIETETSDPRSLFLEFCLSTGSQGSEFGRLLAPLDIKYIILANVPGAQSYAWLGRQRDLKEVFSAEHGLGL